MSNSISIYGLLIRGENFSVNEAATLQAFYEEHGRDGVYAMVEKKKIIPFAARTWISCGYDVDFWTEILNLFRERNAKILACLDKAYQALGRFGVKKMFLSENFSALLSSGADVALFSSGDVDNYASPDEKDKIYAAFESLGYTRTERYAGAHQIAAEFYPPKETDVPEKFYISVDFYPLARLKLPCFIDADDFVDWEALSTYGDTSVVLPPKEALMYICLLHISLHSFSRAPDIRLYIDLLNTAKTKPNYQKIAEWCKRDNTCVRASVAAELCNRLLSTDIPKEITELTSKKNRVISLVYDSEKKDLKYEPHGLKVLKIEMLCHDKGALSGVFAILSPNKAWMKRVYGGRGFLAHIKHWKKVI